MSQGVTRQEDYEYVIPSSQQDRERTKLTRRAFIGGGVALALAAALGVKFAWGDVGGGDWGSVGAAAAPGNHFGHDGGWGYSNNRKVWLSVRCDATVGRMTELFLEISVTSYYANGGYWHPTWSTDYPDTHVDSFVRNSSGWIDSKSGFYDTTYDNSSYHGPYVTDTLRVPREAWDWWAWAGVRAWCDSPDSAYGINTTAEASQLIPSHVLVHDRSFNGKIVTFRSQAAPHLYLDVCGGGVESGTDVWGWELLNTTNQHWIVLESSYGRSVFVPVHIGNVWRCLDIERGSWDDDDNVDIWNGNSGKAQSFWLHNRGNGYHLIIPECSGCAVDLNGGGQVNGTRVSQWNCLSTWANPNCNWIVEEPEFRTRSGNPLTLEGAAEAGGELHVVEHPNDACYPYNYPGTAGMYWWYEFWRFETEPETEYAYGSWPGGTRVQASESASYVPVDEDAGCYIACGVTAWTRWTTSVKYKGQVQTGALFVKNPSVTVNYHADGEETPCFTENVRVSEPYYLNPEANIAAAKPECAGVDGWYIDKAYEVPFDSGTPLTDALELYARNRVELTYAHAETSCLTRDDRTYFADEALSEPLSADAALPAATTWYYGDRVTFERGPSAWFEERGRMREAACEQGAFADATATGSVQRTARLTRNTVAYLKWRTPAYDGISLS